MNSYNNVSDSDAEEEVIELERIEADPPAGLSSFQTRIWYFSAWVSSKTRALKSKVNFTVGIWFPTWLMGMMFRSHNMPLLIKQYDGDRHKIKVDEAQIIVLPLNKDDDDDSVMEAVKDSHTMRRHQIICIKDIQLKEAKRQNRRFLATQRLFWFMRKCELTIEGFSAFVKRCLPDVTDATTHNVFVKIRYTPENHSSHDLFVNLDSGRFDLITDDKEYKNNKFMFGKFTLPASEKVEKMINAPDDSELSEMAGDCLIDLEDAFDNSIGDSYLDQFMAKMDNED